MAPLGPLVLTAGKKAALAGIGLFTGVGGAVAFKLDQVHNHYKPRVADGSASRKRFRIREGSKNRGNFT